MINLLKSELYKLFKNRIFIVCSLFLTCIALFSLNTMYVENDLPVLNGANILKSRAGDNIPLVLMMVFVVYCINAEYSTGRIKIIVSKLKNRKYFYIAKLLICMVGCITLNMISSLTYVIGATVLGGFDPYNSFNFANSIIQMLAQTFILCSYTSLFVVIAFLTRSFAGSIICNLLIILFSPGALDKLNKILNLKKFFTQSSIAAFINSYDINWRLLSVIAANILIILITVLIGTFVFSKKDI